MKTVIAIDGPAASGKSSVARMVARRLGFHYVNSGAFYRSITWWVQQRGIDPSSSDTITSALAEARLASGFENGDAFLRVDDLDASPHLQDEAINGSVSAVSQVAAVRAALLQHLRELADHQNVVMEGRDIGSVVFPNTPFKFYIDASPEVRQQRRQAQGQQDQVAVRDRLDSSRANAPLTIAQDAQVIDSTHLTIESVADEILGRLNQSGLTTVER